MSFGSAPFAESTLAGVVLIPASAPGPESPVVPLIIDPFSIVISDVTHKGLINSLSMEVELGRQGTAQFSLKNLADIPPIGAPVQIYFYDELLFAGAIDRYKITSNNTQTFVQYDFECTDNSYLLFRQKIKKTFTNQTISSIVSSLLNNELFYDGITIGQIDVHMPIPVADADGVSIFEFFNELATSVGAVFYIDNEKQLFFTNTTVLTAVEPLDQDNIESCTINIDRETYHNIQTTTVTGTPAAENDEPLVISITRNNNEEIAQQAAIEGTGGFYHDRLSITHPTSNDTIQLTRLAYAYNKIGLGIAGSIRRSISVRTRQYGYQAGQFVDVTLLHLGITGTWVIQRLNLQEESGRFLISTMELNQTSLIRRSQELWVSVVNKGTIAILPPTAILTNSQLFTTPGSTTFTVPAGITEVQVSCYGGGGGGGGEAVSDWPGYGGRVWADGAKGGGGGLVISVLQVTPGEVLTLVVGAGGAGGAGQYLFQSFTNAIATNGTSGVASSVSRSGSFQVGVAAGGEGGSGGMANARFQQSQSWPPGRGGGGLFGDVITVGGAANGGAGGKWSVGASAENGVAGSSGKILVEW